MVTISCTSFIRPTADDQRSINTNHARKPPKIVPSIEPIRKTEILMLKISKLKNDPILLPSIHPNKIADLSPRNAHMLSINLMITLPMVNPILHPNIPMLNP